MQRTHLFTAVILAGTVTLAACNDSASPPSNDAMLRVVHATATLGALDVLVDGEPVLTGVDFGSAPGAQVPTGTHRLTFRSGSTIVGEFDATLTTAHVNAVVVANGLPQLSSSVIPDTGVVGTNRANIRLVNVVGTNTSEPVELDVLINFPGVASDSTARLGMDTRIASYSSLLYFDPGNFRIRYAPDGTDDVLAEVEFAVAAGEVKVVVLHRDANGQYRVEVITEECATCGS